jgi:hypothetical protein
MKWILLLLAFDSNGVDKEELYTYYTFDECIVFAQSYSKDLDTNEMYYCQEVTTI